MTKKQADKAIAQEIAQLYSENYATFENNAVINEMRAYAESIYNVVLVHREIKRELKEVYNIA